MNEQLAYSPLSTRSEQGRLKIYYREKIGGKWKKKTISWPWKYPAEQVKELVELSKMKDVPERRRMFHRRAWLKKGGCEYGTNNFLCRIIERIKALLERHKQEEKEKKKFGRERYKNPFHRGKQRASGQTPLLSFLNATAKQREMLQRLKEEFPVTKWNEDTWRMVMNETKDAAELHQMGKRKLGL